MVMKLKILTGRNKMQASFDMAFELLLKAEGGLSDDPHDKGGLTKYGISQRAYPELNISSLTKEQVKDIYRRDYWERCRCNELSYPMNVIVFDTAVNMGCVKAIKLLQKTLNIPLDGIIGEMTLNAAKSATESAAAQYLLSRLMDYAGQPGWSRYKNGWFNRIYTLAGEIL